MNRTVKITVDEDGTIVENPVWHLAVNFGDAPRMFCTGEVFGSGESTNESTVRLTKRGGITCPECLRMIKHIKSIKL